MIVSPARIISRAVAGSTRSAATFLTVTRAPTWCVGRTVVQDQPMSDPSPAPRRTLSVGRVEAFSDGVMAVAITLLVLDLHVEVGKESLAEQLRQNWPSYAAYAISFFVIGVVWVNHHALLSLLRATDRTLVFYNLLLLMFVTLLPFTTSTLAAYLREGGADERLAVLLYGAATEGMAISFTLLLRHMLRHDLVRRTPTREEGRVAVRRFGVGTVLYPIVTAIGLLSPGLMLLFYGLVSAFYMFDQTPVLAADS